MSIVQDQAFAFLTTKERTERLLTELANVKADENEAWALIKAGVDPNARDDIGRTPLMLCARFGFVDTLDVLLKEKPDLEMKNDAGYTALTFAAINNRMNCVQKLVAVGACYKTCDKRGQNILMRCITRGFQTMSIYFLDLGLNIFDKDDRDRDAFYFASRSKNQSMKKWVAEEVANATERRRQRSFALRQACVSVKPGIKIERVRFTGKK